MNLDSLIVGGYFVAIFIAGYIISRRHAHGGADEFTTGGKTQTWYENGLALLGMAVDPGYMSIAALGFIYGLYVTQWTGVHVWFTTWFAAMFFLPIYWRSRIVTTPEFLEKRFNVQCRVVFSLLMVVILVTTLGLGLYLGGLLLSELIGWNLWGGVAFIAVVTGFYVILGGMRTVLALDVWQAVFLFITLVAVGAMAVHHVGGLAGLAAIQATGKAGGVLPSIVPPSEWSLTTTTFFPAQAIVAWATIAGLSWLACNFGMAQRILAAKTERDAQKSLLFLGVLAAIVPTCSFLVGVSMRHIDPTVLPDKAFLHVMLNWFPVGIRGLLAAGMMAALLSTADGLLTGCGALMLEDIYVRFLRPAAGEQERKQFTRLIEFLTLLSGVGLVCVFQRQMSAMERLQGLYADVLGVIVAIYLVGMFSKRATPRAAFIGMIFGIVLAGTFELFNARSEVQHKLNLAYIGCFSFLATVLVTMVLSRFERPLPIERLTNLTIHTLPDVKGPWVGLKAWPGLWKWALIMAMTWFGLSASWEYYVRTRGAAGVTPTRPASLPAAPAAGSQAQQNIGQHITVDTTTPRIQQGEPIMAKDKLHIVAIGAHIGDAEITAGLLITKYTAAGDRATIVHMTAGEKGNPKMDHREYRKQRIKEAEEAAQKMGASECIVLDHPDGELQADQATINEMCDLIRRLKPDIVLTHWRGSFHRDHRATYNTVMEGGFLAALPGIQRKDPAHLIRGLYYLENWEDLEEYQPDLWLDVSGVFDRWVEACKCHQLLRGEVSFGYLHYYTGLAAKRGAEVGVKYAVTVGLPPISRKRKVEFFPIEQEPVLIF